MVTLPFFRKSEAVDISAEIFVGDAVVILNETEHIAGIVDRIDYEKRSAFVRFPAPDPESTKRWWRVWVPEERLMNAHAYRAAITNE